MSRLAWGQPGTRFYEIGVDRGVLYVDNDPGIAWSGLVSVEENPSGGDTTAYYLDGVKYQNLYDGEEFEGTISAYYSPPEFDECDGSLSIRPGLVATQQKRKTFSLSYRTKIGNDTHGKNHGYKIHLVFNALAEPTQKKYETVSDKVDAQLLSWAFTTKPIQIPGNGYAAHLIVDSTEATPYALATIEDILYGDEDNFPRLPTIEEILALFDNAVPLTVTDSGDGKFTIDGSGLAVMFVSDDEWQITGDTIIENADGAEISSEV